VENILVNFETRAWILMRLLHGELKYFLFKNILK
jgi:hypothetical protein